METKTISPLPPPAGVAAGIKLAVGAIIVGKGVFMTTGRIVVGSIVWVGDRVAVTWVITGAAVAVGTIIAVGELVEVGVETAAIPPPRKFFKPIPPTTSRPTSTIPPRTKRSQWFPRVFIELGSDPDLPGPGRVISAELAIWFSEEEGASIPGWKVGDWLARRVEASYVFRLAAVFELINASLKSSAL